MNVGPADAKFTEEVAMTLTKLRKVKTNSGKEEKDLQKELERLKKTVPDMPGMEKMEKFLKQMQEAKQNGSITKEQIKQFADEYSGDSTHQYLALEALASDLESTDPELAKDIRSYNAEFYDENKIDIQVGINSSQTAAEIAEKTGGTVQQYRDIMRNGGIRVPDITTPLEAYQHAKQHSTSYEDIDSTIQMLREGLANELAAVTPSVDSAQLVHIRKRLEVIFGLKTIIETSQQNEYSIDRLLVRAPV